MKDSMFWASVALKSGLTAGLSFGYEQLIGEPSLGPSIKDLFRSRSKIDIDKAPTNNYEPKIFDQLYKQQEPFEVAASADMCKGLTDYGRYGAWHPGFYTDPDVKPLFDLWKKISDIYDAIKPALKSIQNRQLLIVPEPVLRQPPALFYYFYFEGLSA